MGRTTYIRHRSRKPFGDALKAEHKFICKDCGSRVVTAKIQLAIDEQCERCKNDQAVDLLVMKNNNWM